MNTSDNNKLTKQSFEQLIEHDKKHFRVEKKFLEDIYTIRLDNSFLYCVIQKTEHGVQIIYLDSYYENESYISKLIGYATFVIAYKINGNRGFNEIEFNNNGQITKIK